MKTVLVTGCAGFIGSHVCEKLVARENSVVCIDDFNDFYDPKAKKHNISGLKKSDRFALYKGDIRDFNFLKKVFKKEDIDKVIHLAARTGVRPSITDPVLYEEVNIKGTLNLLEVSKQHKIKNFVFGSSSSIYGLAKKVPFSETDDVDNMISPYAASKRAGEIMCNLYHNLYGMKITCLRFFTVYGPRGRPDMAPYKFMKLINDDHEIGMYGSGTSSRDYTFVSDIVAGIVAALDKNLEFEIINLGNSKPVKLKKFISIIEKQLGKKAEIKQLPEQQGDVPVTYANISKAKKLLGYSPKVSIKEGMKLFVKWYKISEYRLETLRPYAVNEARISDLQGLSRMVA